MRLNRAECTTKNDAKGTYVEPIVAAGAVVDPSAKNIRTIERKLRPFDTEKHFLTIFVSPDSFKEFDVVKNAMVRAGFEYRLVPVPVREKVYMGTPTGNPLVQ